MTYKRTFFPNILIHPGMSLKDILEGENMTQSDLSLRTDISEKHISNIIKGKASITPETALKFHKVFGISAEFWNNLQKSYEEDKARLEEKELMASKIEEEKEVLTKIKDGYKDLAENGFVEKISFVGQKNKEEILNNLYNFLKVSSLKNILNIFKINLMFKKTDTLKLNEYNLACWLRGGEVKIEHLEVGEYSKVRLKEVLIELKAMTKNDFVDIAKIQELLASAGIYFSFVPGFKNVPVYGITRRYMGKPFIQISDKGKKADGFWFALFHELAHVQFHLHKKDDVFLNISDEEQDIEADANKWAGEYLIHANDFKELIKITPINKTKIDSFCEKQGIGVSILAGRLAHHYHQSGYKDAYREVSTLRKSLEIINN